MLTVTMEPVDDLDLAVLAHAPLAPAEEDWATLIEEWDAFGRRVRARGRMPKCLVLSEKGFGPNAKQRKLLDDVNREVRPRIAVVSGSTAARGIVTAIAWLGNSEIRAFSPSDIDGALAYLEVPDGGRASVDRATAIVHERLSA